MEDFSLAELMAEVQLRIRETNGLEFCDIHVLNDVVRGINEHKADLRA